jgi:hypothetical protein
MDADFKGLLGIGVEVAKQFLPAGAAAAVDAGVKVAGQIRKGCGATDAADKLPNPSGPSIPLDDNRNHAVMYWIEGGMDNPNLPILEGWTNSKRGMQILEDAFQAWELKLKMNVSWATDIKSANLIITSEKFDANVAAAVLALTDIGPLHTRKCRLIFDLGEKFTEETFKYTAMHEFGHALGIKHADLAGKTNVLMGPVMDTSIKMPSDHDIAAAVTHKWVKS